VQCRVPPTGVSLLFAPTATLLVTALKKHTVFVQPSRLWQRLLETRVRSRLQVLL